MICYIAPLMEVSACKHLLQPAHNRASASVSTERAEQNKMVEIHCVMGGYRYHDPSALSVNFPYHYRYRYQLPRLSSISLSNRALLLYTNAIAPSLVVLPCAVVDISLSTTGIVILIDIIIGYRYRHHQRLSL